MVGYPGGVAKRTKATVCKTVIRGFESRRRLFIQAMKNILLKARSSPSPFSTYGSSLSVCVWKREANVTP